MPRFSMLENFSSRRDVSNSLDEILIGQIVACMADRGCPLDGLRSEPDQTTVHFQCPQDSLLHSVLVVLKRSGDLRSLTGPSRAHLTVTAEVKNFLGRPQDLLAFHREELSRLQATPVFPDGMKACHQLNSVLVSCERSTGFDGLTEPGSLQQVSALMEEALEALRKQLDPFKRRSELEPGAT